MGGQIRLPFATCYSPLTTRQSPFTIRYSPFATRHSLLAVVLPVASRYSPFAAVSARQEPRPPISFCKPLVTLKLPLRKPFRTVDADGTALSTTTHSGVAFELVT
jgi:hypothetical protein